MARYSDGPGGIYLTIAKTTDEFDNERFFVENEAGDWIEGPFDTRDLAVDAATDIYNREKRNLEAS